MSQDESAKLKELIEKKKQLEQELAKFSRLVTVMFTDIVGSTSYFEKYGDVAGLVYVHNCIDRLAPVAEKHGGTISKTIGDAVMAYFEDPVGAINAAVEMQRVLEAYNALQIEESEQIFVRIGMNYGPGMIKDKDVFGDAVNAAARIESITKSQQILISTTEKESKARAAWEEKIRAARVPLRKLPEASVKGKAEKLEVFEVLWREITADKPVEVAPTTPQMAGRVNVTKAAESASEKGTMIIEAPSAAVPRLAISLVVVRPDGNPGQKYPLAKPEMILGRVEGDMLFPDDPLVSRRHARFHVTSDAVAVEDMNSANGIFCRLNKPHSLRSGDIILMGREMFRFVERAEVAAPVAQGMETATVLGGPAVPAVQSAELVRLKPGGIEDQRFPLLAGENILGRTRGTLTFPDDAYLSSQHCRIALQDGNYVLEDLKAVNGTFVAIRDRTSLSDGDILLIGHQLLRVTIEPA
jgi:class 3 adenylate cyclase/pSer/pThr/pTyr-binding forkhead associated (FHA) protein